MRASKLLIFASCLLLAHSLRAECVIVNLGSNISSGKIDFGQVPVGSYKDTTFILTNIECDSLNILAIETNVPFLVVNPKPFTLGPACSYSVHIRFVPTEIGLDSQNIRLRVDLGGFAALIRDTSFGVDGMGVKPQSIIQGGTYNFGQDEVGSTIYRKEIIQNMFGTGTQYVTWAPPNAPFSVLGSQGTAIPAGSNDTLVMAFQPTAPSYDSTTLHVYISQGGTTDTLELGLVGTAFASGVDAQASHTESLNLISYPNPASSSFEISYNLDQPSRAMLTLYDVIGNEVATLSDGEESSGLHSIAFNTNKYLSGEYLCLLRIASTNGIVSTNFCRVVIAKP